MQGPVMQYWNKKMQGVATFRQYSNMMNISRTVAGSCGVKLLVCKRLGLLRLGFLKRRVLNHRWLKPNAAAVLAGTEGDALC